MWVNISNQYGRALEYIIVEEIVKQMPPGKIELTSSAKRDQGRDEEKFASLPSYLKEDYLKCAFDVFTWLDHKLSISNKAILLHRLTDQDARRGDVTDIRLTFELETVNLSIKHRHDALKHQRPPSTAQWCGYMKGSIKDKEFRTEYDLITDRFLEAARKLNPNAEYFRELKQVTGDFIKNHLYKPVCSLVCDFINNNCSSPEPSKHLFGFLVGRTNFYKIINSGQETFIYKFIDLLHAASVNAVCFRSSYVLLRFDNGWEISMRLHTAASALSKDIKFDTRATNLEDVVPYEKCGSKNGLL